MKIEMHYPAKGDLPEPSGEMYAERKPVLAYTKSLGWTQAQNVRSIFSGITAQTARKRTTDSESFVLGFSEEE